jgi:TusA-related sulfurtransferase
MDTDGSATRTLTPMKISENRDAGGVTKWPFPPEECNSQTLTYVKYRKQRRQKTARKSAQSEFEVEHVLNLRGMIIPLTLLKITQGFRKIEAGETMAIIGTDPDTRKDILKVLGTSPAKCCASMMKTIII